MKTFTIASLYALLAMTATATATPITRGQAQTAMRFGRAANSTDTAAAAASGTNLQAFTGALGGAAAPTVVNNGDPSRAFTVTGDGGDTFVGLGAALGRSCDVQKNLCAAVVHSGSDATVSAVSQCDDQNTQCHAANSLKRSLGVVPGLEDRDSQAADVVGRDAADDDDDEEEEEADPLDEAAANAAAGGEAPGEEED